MAVSFNFIPNSLRVPLLYVELDQSRANQSAPQPGRALLIGPALPAIPKRLDGQVDPTPRGTAELNRLYQVHSVAEARTLFGAGSPLFRMVQAFFANATLAECFCINSGLTGVSDSGLYRWNMYFALTGRARAAATWYLYIGADRVPVTVAAGADDKQVKRAIVSAINSRPDLPVFAVYSTTTSSNFRLVLASKTGMDGNRRIPIRINAEDGDDERSRASGFTLPQPAGIAQGNTGDLDWTNISPVIGDEDFDFVAIADTTDATIEAVDQLFGQESGRWSYARQAYGHVFGSRPGSARPLAAWGRLRNNRHLTILSLRDNVYPYSPEWEWSAALAAVAARYLSLDPARPLQTLPLLGVTSAGSFTWDRRNLLLNAGLSTYTLRAGDVPRLDRVITTYQQNAFGHPDTSYLDITTLFSLMYITRYLRQRITSKFPRHKLANDGTRYGPGQAIATPSVIRSELIAAYSELESLGIVENVQVFSRNLIVERNSLDPNRIDVLFPPDLINQLRVFAVLNQFRLQEDLRA